MINKVKLFLSDSSPLWKQVELIFILLVIITVPVLIVAHNTDLFSKIAFLYFMHPVIIINGL